MFTVSLTEIEELSPSTREFRFTRDDGQALAYKPGQFYRFVFSDTAGEFERSYSLCNFSELYGNELVLVVSQVESGRATKLLFDAKPGLSAKLTGPFGRLTLPATKPAADPSRFPSTFPARLVLVATSVGLAPYLPILKQLETLEFERVVLLLGVRGRSEFIYGDLLLEYAERNKFFELTLCLSREKAEMSFEADGYVTGQLEALHVDPDQDHFLLCGNPAMVDDCYGYLKEAGCKPRQVVREKYVFAREAKASKQSLTDEQKKLIAEKMSRHTS